MCASAMSETKKYDILKKQQRENQRMGMQRKKKEQTVKANGQQYKLKIDEEEDVFRVLTPRQRFTGNSLFLLGAVSLV